MAELTTALRIKSTKAQPAPTDDDKCAYPGCFSRGYQLRYHHVDPTFAQICDECLLLIGEEEQQSLFGYDKFLPGVYCVADCIPDNHPAVVRLHELHIGNKWIWLCDFHHKMMHKRTN